jgi:hypothetical protein
MWSSHWKLIQQPTRKEDWETGEGRLRINLEEDWEFLWVRRRLFVRGSKVMLIVRVRLQFNYLYLKDFCNFWLL